MSKYQKKFYVINSQILSKEELYEYIYNNIDLIDLKNYIKKKDRVKKLNKLYGK